MASRANNDGVFKRKDRPGFWISWFDAQGRRRYRKTEAATLSQARAARSAETVRVEQAKTLGFMPPGEDSFSEISERFLQYQKARLTPKSYTREKLIVDRHLKPFFSGKLAAIRRTDIQRYVTARFGKELSAHSVLKELNVLKHLLRLAVEWELIPLNPAQGVKSPRVPAGRVRYLQAGELVTVLGECPEWLARIVALAVSTGMRRSELLGLRWLDIDVKHGRAMLPQTKNGEGRIVYLNRIASEAIASLPVGEDTPPMARLFSDVTPEQVSMRFARVCRKVGIADFRFHDLRHTAASWLRMQGADIHTVAQLLGHKDLRMAARYQHLSPDFLEKAVRGLDVVFGNLCYPGVTSVAALPEGNLASAAK